MSKVILKRIGRKLWKNVTEMKRMILLALYR